MVRIGGALLVLGLAAAATGCRSLPSPGTALRDAHVVDGPVLIKRGDRYYLRYRRDTATRNEPPLLRLLVVAKKTTDAGYYYFTVPVSQPEWGNLVERPVAVDDGMEDLARAARVFWLDPDGSARPIPIRSEDLGREPELGRR